MVREHGTRWRKLKIEFMLKNNGACSVCGFAPRILHNLPLYTPLNSVVGQVLNKNKLVIDVVGKEYCIVCPFYALELHHKIPLFLGGAEFDKDNLVLLCRSCHKKAHTNKK